MILVRISFVSLMLLVVATPQLVQAVPPELQTLQDQYAKLLFERVDAVYAAAVGQLNTRYVVAVDRSIEAAKSAGDLAGVLALEEEKKRIEQKQPVPDDDASTNAALVKLRPIYREQIAKLAEQRSANQTAVLGPYIARLKQLEAVLTKADRVADAKEVMGYRISLNVQPVAQAPATPTAAPFEPPSVVGAGGGTPAFTNSLGMKFVKVPGTKVQFCIHETRKQDYAAYAADNSSVDPTWKNVKSEGVPISFADDHPVQDVTWTEAQAFCAWLSKKEGKLYRLPTDREWSVAVGVGREERKSDVPGALSGKVKGAYPWGTQWPPPADAGNYADLSAKAKFATMVVLDGVEDGFPTSAPVMHFKPNKLGLYDMGGNAWEWCEDWLDAAKVTKVLRGASWSYAEQGALLSSARVAAVPDRRSYSYGFRVVLAE